MVSGARFSTDKGLAWCARLCRVCPGRAGRSHSEHDLYPAAVRLRRTARVRPCARRSPLWDQYPRHHPLPDRRGRKAGANAGTPEPGVGRCIGGARGERGHRGRLVPAGRRHRRRASARASTTSWAAPSTPARSSERAGEIRSSRVASGRQRW
jgi:hypothetical protein